MDHTFFGPEPSELAVLCQLPGESRHVVSERREATPANQSAQIPDCRNAEFCPPAESEGQTMSFHAGVGLEDAIRCGIIGIFIDCVRSDLLQRSGEAKIDNAYIGNLRIAQVQFLQQAHATTRCSGKRLITEAVHGDFYF